MVLIRYDEGWEKSLPLGFITPFTSVQKADSKSGREGTPQTLVRGWDHLTLLHYVSLEECTGRGGREIFILVSTEF